MYIVKVLSYQGSWDILNSEYKDELYELLSALDLSMQSLDHFAVGSKMSNLREEWHIALEQMGWLTHTLTHFGHTAKRVNLRSLGPIKNGLSAALPHLSEPLTRWLFSLTTIAIRNGMVRLPILFVPTASLSKRLARSSIYRDSFDSLNNQLQNLVPLNHPYPFIIIGFSDEPLETEIIDIAGVTIVDDTHSIIERSIEFPPEYHVAGLNILNFFGTYLREQYPNEAAKVKIEQEGLIVRLIVEAKDGRLEVIEKALHEYQLIMTGKEAPETVTNNEILLLQLRSELRFAQLRVENQRDIINIKSGEIDRLYKLVEQGLSGSPSISIDFHPIITTTTSFDFKDDMSNIISDVNRLKSIFKPTDPAYKLLRELESPLLVSQAKSTPESVKNSEGMKKLKDFIDKVSTGNKGIEKSLKVAGKSYELFKELAGNYNKVAQWCGLPQVPTIFTK